MFSPIGRNALFCCSRFVFLFLITAAKEAGYVMPGVCVSVCLSVSKENTERIFTKILSQMNLWTRKNSLNFGSHRPPDAHSGIFEMIYQHCETGHFPTVWLISPERVIGFS